jgi:membrane protease subunit (stomatin/prohibitin family)
MAVIDVVKYDGNDDEFVWKYPSEDLRLGTQLVVKTAQTAFFVRGGKILDQFEPGTETLKSGNIPLLNKLVNIPFGGDSPFQAEVWFVNLISKLDNKWGTPTPIQLEDPKYGIVIPVRAFGQFGLKIGNPRLFLESLVGTMKVYSAQKIVEYFKGKIISTISTAIGKKMIIEGISILQMSAFLDDLSIYSAEAIKEEFAKYGVEIENFFIMSINIPEDDPSVVKLKEAKEKAMLLNTVGKDVYQFDKSTDVLQAAAENEGGTAGNMMGAGMGLGMGLGVGGAMGGQMGNIGKQLNTNLNQEQSQQQSEPPSSPAPPPPPQITQYHVYIDNQQLGPFTLDHINTMISEEKITKDTNVWKDGLADWTKAGDQEDLKNMFGPPKPPPPPS